LFSAYFSAAQALPALHNDMVASLLQKAGAGTELYLSVFLKEVIATPPDRSLPLGRAGA
jgi:hypothetical protein